MDSSNLIISGDGSHTIHSDKFGATYHSIHGAIQESRTVFIDAGLDYMSQKREKVHIFEMGFGTGLNALMSMQYAENHKQHILYHSIEAYPILLKEAKALNYTDQLQYEQEASFINMHNTNNQVQLSPYFKFQKFIGHFEDFEFSACYDVIYYDAFAPSAQPHLWEEHCLTKCYNAISDGGVLVTYCAKGSLKRLLHSIGFTVEALPGPPRKREITRAIKR